VNFAAGEVARNFVNTGKFPKISVLIQTEQITAENVYYRLRYLISYLLFCEKGVLM